MAISWKDLYGSNWSKHFGGGGGTYDSQTLRRKYEDIDEETMADFQTLSAPQGRVASSEASSQQMIPSPPVMPVSSRAGGVGWSKGVGPGWRGLPGGPSLNIPAYDYKKVEALGQRFAAPGIRNLRNAVQQTQQGYYENPNVKSQTLRDALAGYGQGLEDVVAGATKTGAGIYGQEYGAGVNAEMARFQAAEQRALQSERLAAEERMQRDRLNNSNYQRAYDQYLRRLG